MHSARLASRRWLNLAVSATVLLVLALTTLMFVYHGWRAITFPFQLDYGEGPLLDQVVRLGRFENIYRSDLSSPPYTIANYPPLYMLVQTPLEWLFGPAFWYGRLLSWLSVVAAAACAGLLLHTLTGDRLAALAGALTLLAVPYVSYWAPLFRIDSLALGLSLAALLVVVRWPSGRAGLIAAALLLTAAIYTRQSYGLAAPLAAFVWLLNRRPRRALALAGLVAAVGLGLFATLNWLTGGGFFFNIVTANVNEFWVDTLQDYRQELWELLPVLILSGGLFLATGLIRRSEAWWLIAPYLLGAAASALTIGKIGSNVNYLLELSAALALAAGGLLAWLREQRLPRALLALALALQLVQLVPGARYHRFLEARYAGRADEAALLQVIRAARGPVLADEHMGLLVLNRRPIPLQPFELTQLARAGAWDQGPLLAAIDRQEFEAVLIFKPGGYPLHRERWTSEMLGALNDRYRPAEQFGSTVVYRPR